MPDDTYRPSSSSHSHRSEKKADIPSDETALPKDEPDPKPVESTPEDTPIIPPSVPEEINAGPVYESVSSSEGERASGSFPKILLFLVLLLFIGGGVLAYLKFKPNFSFSLPFSLPFGQTAKPTTTLTYWGLWEPNEVMKPVLDEWQKNHPDIVIDYQYQSKQDYRARLQSSLAKGSGPDIFRYHLTWVPMLKNDLDPVPASVISSADFESAYYPVMTEHLRRGTAYLGLPLEVDTLALFYNEDIFQKAGQTPPTSWNELETLAKSLVVPDPDRKGMVKRGGVALGTTNNVDHWSDILGLLIMQNAGDPANPSLTQTQDALAFYTQFYKNDKVWDETLPSSTLAFATEKVAMYFGFSWDVFEIKEINPQLRFRVIPVPQTGNQAVNWASFWVEGVAAQSTQKAAAWEFLKFLSSPETMQLLYANQSKIRLFGEPYARKDMANLLAGNSFVTPFLVQAPTAKTWYLCSRTYDDGLNDSMIKYYEDAVNIVNQGRKPAEALQTTASGVTQVTARWGLTPP